MVLGSDQNFQTSNLGSQAELASSNSSLDDQLHSNSSAMRCFGWTTEQVGQWLYEIGLAHLVTLFMQNVIDGKALLLMDSNRMKVCSHLLLCVRK